MLEQQFYDVSYVLLDVFHSVIFILFGICAARFFLVKDAPYSSMYVGIVAFIQAIYNGCPLTDVVNLFAVKSGNIVVSNQFLFVFFDWYWFSRVLILCVSLLLLYHSYVTWNKPRTVVNFSRILRFSNLTSFLTRMKT